MRYLSVLFALLILLSFGCTSRQPAASEPASVFEYNDQAETYWSSPENRNGVKGSGGKENGKAKGHPFDSIPAGASYTLLDIQGQGVINRIWMTLDNRTPEMLRSLKIEMFWDGESKPAVAAPLGDFFGVGLGKTTVFENALFANTEGRSFVSLLQMPFRKAARIVITNESDKTLGSLYYDVNYNLLSVWNEKYLYLHAYWHRDTATKLTEDFELLPSVTGKGRFLGVNVGVNANPQYGKSWFGEGEVKMYLDGDTDYPSLNGTGTEDYIGTGWGQGRFINAYLGCTVANDTTLQYAFYRYHIPDPVYFKTDCKVTLQQIGGDATENVAKYQQKGAPLIPVTTHTGKLVWQYKKGEITQLDPAKLKGWTNFYRQDDVSAVAYFYLDKPASNLPALQPVAMRTANLRTK